MTYITILEQFMLINSYLTKIIIHTTLTLMLCVLAYPSSNTWKVTNHESEKKEEKSALVKADDMDVFYTEEVKNDCRVVSDQAKQKFLEVYNATEKQYSILFFTQRFNGEK